MAMRKSPLFVAATMSLITGFVSTTAAAAPEPTKEKTRAQVERIHDLQVGDPAPALQGLEFVKGDSVSAFQPGKVYVVEFWATWCGPCVASMPHLSKLQKQYAGEVTIIGVTCPDRRNTREAVEQMVKDKGDVMAYTVAWDPQSQTSSAYMKPAGRNSIPTAFVVDQLGRIAFIGSPSGLDQTLKELSAGTHDINAAAEAYVERLRADQLFREFTRQLRSDKDYAEAYATARQLLTGPHWNDADALNSLAWLIVDPHNGPEQKELSLALKAAERADELTEHRNPEIIDTLARVHFASGDAAKALELQKRAVEMAQESGNQRLAEDLTGPLAEYEAAAGR